MRELLVNNLELNPYRVRQPLPSLLVVVPSEEDKQALERVSDQITEEVNVKKLVVIVRLPEKELK